VPTACQPVAVCCQLTDEVVVLLVLVFDSELAGVEGVAVWSVLFGACLVVTCQIIRPKIINKGRATNRKVLRVLDIYYQLN